MTTTPDGMPPPLGEPAGTALLETPPALERRDGAWRVLPIEGAFALAYADVAGARTRRRLFAQELKIGPGKVLLGGFDPERDGYRGFRADRIERLTDLETGAIIERNILDWLVKRAERTLRARRLEARRAA